MSRIERNNEVQPILNSGFNACRTRIMNSKSAKYMFCNFKITIPENINTHPYLRSSKKHVPILKKKLPSFDWNFLHESSRNDEDDIYGTLEEDNEDTNGYDIDMNQTNEDTNFVVVYNNSVSYGIEDTTPLPGSVLSANVITSNEFSKDDTLVVCLKGYGIYFIKFLKDSIYCKPIVVECLLYKNSFLKNEDLQPGFEISFNQFGDIMILKSNNSIAQIHYLEYDKFGIPKIGQSHNINYSGQLLKQITVPIDGKNDALITSVMSDDDILMFVCLYDLKSLRKHTIMMKNTFQSVIYQIPLVNTKAVLFLHKNTYTFKPLGFFINGDDVNPQSYQYFEEENSNIVESFYIPKKKLPTIASIENKLKQHDQIIVSFGKQNQVIAIDVFYDSIRHEYTTKTTFLFKWKYSLDLFILEYFDNNYNLIYSNKCGVYEEISFKPEYIKAIEHNIVTRPYPINDCIFINTPTTKHYLEYKQSECWAITGSKNSNHLMNIWTGYSFMSFPSKQVFNNLKNVFLIERLHESYLLLSINGKTQLCLVNDKEEGMNINQPLKCINNNFLDEETIFVHPFSDKLRLIVSKTHLLIINTIHMTKIWDLKVSFDIKLVGAYDNIIAICYQNQSSTYSFEIFKFSDNFELENIEIKNWEMGSLELSCIYFWNYGDVLNLIICDVEGIIYHFADFVFQQKTFTMDGLNPILDVKPIIQEIQFISEKEKLLITTKSGEYTIIDYISGNFDLNKNFKYIKLSNCPIKIILKSDNEIFLLGSYLWWINFPRVYPERVYLNNTKESIISLAIFVKDNGRTGDTLFLICNNKLLIMSFIHKKDVFNKSFKLSAPCDKILNYPTLNLLIIKACQDKDSLSIGRSKLYFFDTNLEARLKCVPQHEAKIFEDDVFPECLYEWRCYSDSKFYVNLIVGCSTKQNQGKLILFKVSKKSKTVFLDRLFSSNFEKPITHIEIINEHLFFASGSKIFKKHYDHERRKFISDETFYETFGDIKKFFGKFNENKNYELTILKNDNTMLHIILTGEGYLIKSYDFIDRTNDIIVLSNNIIGSLDQKTNILRLIDSKTDSRVEVSVPEDCFLFEYKYYSPWINFFERNEKDPNLTIIALGRDGEMDLIQIPKITTQSRMDKIVSTSSKFEAIPEMLENIKNINELKKGITIDREMNVNYDVELDKFMSRTMI